MAFSKVIIKCTDRDDKAIEADVLEWSRKHMKIVLDDTNFAINLHHNGREYVGSFSGMEFRCEDKYENK